MASTSEMATGKTGNKRLGGPLSELPSNIKPKRSKPDPDSCPGSKVTDKLSNIETSSDQVLQGSAFEEPGVERQDLVGDESKTTDEDKKALEEEAEVFEEDGIAEDEDAGEAKELASELVEWFGQCEANDPLADLHPIERQFRINTCRDRFTLALETLIETAKNLKKKDFEDEKQADKLPMTKSWWTFFINMSIKEVLDLLHASLPESVEGILGGSMSSKELLMLPSQWETCNLWAVYADAVRESDKGSGSPDLGRYCGSGTSKKVYAHD